MVTQGLRAAGIAQRNGYPGLARSRDSVAQCPKGEAQERRVLTRQEGPILVPLCLALAPLPTATPACPKKISFCHVSDCCPDLRSQRRTCCETRLTAGSGPPS